MVMTDHIDEVFIKPIEYATEVEDLIYEYERLKAEESPSDATTKLLTHLYAQDTGNTKLNDTIWAVAESLIDYLIENKQHPLTQTNRSGLSSSTLLEFIDFMYTSIDKKTYSFTRTPWDISNNLVQKSESISPINLESIETFAEQSLNIFASEKRYETVNILNLTQKILKSDGSNYNKQMSTSILLHRLFVKLSPVEDEQQRNLTITSIENYIEANQNI